MIASITFIDTLTDADLAQLLKVIETGGGFFIALLPITRLTESTKIHARGIKSIVTKPFLRSTMREER